MWSYNPNLETPRDKVRFYIQDNKEEDTFFEDEEIDAVLKDCPNPKTCAIQLCYVLSALFAGVPDDEKVGPYSVSYKTLSQKYLKLAESLRSQQSRILSGFAGGIYIADTIETLRNKSLTHVAFERYMMKNRRGW